MNLPVPLPLPSHPQHRRQRSPSWRAHRTHTLRTTTLAPLSFSQYLSQPTLPLQEMSTAASDSRPDITQTERLKTTPEALRSLQEQWRERRRIKMEEMARKRYGNIGGDVGFGVRKGEAEYDKLATPSQATVKHMQQSDPSPSVRVLAASRSGSRQLTEAEPNVQTNVRMVKAQAVVPKFSIPRDTPETRHRGGNDENFVTPYRYQSRLGSLSHAPRMMNLRSEAPASSPKAKNARVEPDGLARTKSPGITKGTKMGPPASRTRQQQQHMASSSRATPTRVDTSIANLSSILDDNVRPEPYQKNEGGSHRQPPRLSQKNLRPSPVLLDPHPLPTGSHILSGRAKLRVHARPSPTSHQVILSIVSVKEKLVVLDRGRELRIYKRSPSGEKEGKRVIRLEENAKWGKAEEAVWQAVDGLMDRLKRKTVKIIRYFPQGVLEIMCNYPPDILFTTCPTPSYDCSGTTTLIADLSKASRAPPSRCRILLSPGRRLVKISIRRSFPEESGVNSETELGYRSRRQIKLRRDDDIVEQLQGTLQEQIGGVRNGKNRWVDEEVAVLRDFISLSAYWQ